MCTIQFIPDTNKVVEDPNSYTGYAREAEIMSLEKYQDILSKFIPYKSYIKYISLHGCGEPLLDQTLVDKVKFTRDSGFQNVGFTSNCHFLSPSLSERLLQAGLTCIIPSIDGFTKETHEQIRGRTDFERIKENVNEFIRLRDQYSSDCKVVVRMVVQKDNHHEWQNYYDYWSNRLDPSKGDVCTGFGIHNTGGRVSDYQNKRLDSGDEFKDVASMFSNFAPSIDLSELFSSSSINNSNDLVCLDPVEYESRALCPDLFTRLSIFASGKTALCSADQAEYHPIGSVLDFEDPIDLFNSKYFNEYRDSWMNRSIDCHSQCKECTIAVSRFLKHA